MELYQLCQSSKIIMNKTAKNHSREKKKKGLIYSLVLRKQ